MNSRHGRDASKKLPIAAGLVVLLASPLLLLWASRPQIDTVRGESWIEEELARQEARMAARLPRPRLFERPSPLKERGAFRTVRRAKSAAFKVTLRNRSDCIPTRPTTQLSGPWDRTVPTRIGSLKTEPVRIWPGLIVVEPVTLQPQ